MHSKKNNTKKTLPQVFTFLADIHSDVCFMLWHIPKNHHGPLSIAFKKIHIYIFRWVNTAEGHHWLWLFLGNLQQSFCSCVIPLSAATGLLLGIAFFTVAGEDVTISGCESHATWTAQSHGLQLGSLWPAAVAGGTERLFQNSTERHHWLWAWDLTATSFTASQKHHLQWRRQKIRTIALDPCRVLITRTPLITPNPLFR